MVVVRRRLYSRRCSMIFLGTASQIRRFSSFNLYATYAGNEPMSEKRYHVVYTGRLVPGTDSVSAKSNLIIDTGLSEDKAERLIKQKRVLLKRFPTVTEAQRMAEEFERAGLICVIEDHSAAIGDAAGQGSGESSLVTLMHKIIPTTRKERSASKNR